MVIVEGFLVSGYSHMTQQVSDLGAYSLYGSYALLQNLNFCVFGILVVAFAMGLRQELRASKAMTVTLGLFGATFFALTGLHMTHVAIGVTYLGVVAAMVSAGKLESEDVEISGLYWHFVDLVWMFIFPLVYLLSVQMR